MEVEADVEHAGRVAQVPAGERADVVRRPGDGGEVPQLARCVVDRGVGGQHEVLADLRDARHGVVGGDPLDDEAGVAGRGIRDVEVGGEGGGVGEHDAATGPHPGCRDDRLVEVDRRRVGAHDLSGRRADEPSRWHPRRASARPATPASFQLAMRSFPHWRWTTSATASATPVGRAPRELPSR